MISFQLVVIFILTLNRNIFDQKRMKYFQIISRCLCIVVCKYVMYVMYTYTMYVKVWYAGKKYLILNDDNTIIHLFILILNSM